MSHTVYLSAGTNLGDRDTNLREAISSLNRFRAVVRRVSSIYETEPVGYSNQPWFLNIAIEVDTDLSPLALVDSCQEIEQVHGRERSFANAPRTLDLDILLYDDMVTRTSRLTIPHPRMTERKFVLVPLAELVPEVIHPILKQSIKALLDSCQDRSQVRKY
jgi:2-amino-4-hydroxy-6-hydroxymethyldihydropteridine diphosphokinase